MPLSIAHRRLWRNGYLALDEARRFLAAVRDAKQLQARRIPLLRGRHVALLSSGPCAAQAAFSRAVQDAGGRVAVLDTGAWLPVAEPDIAAAARMLASLYVAVDCCGLPADLIYRIEQHASIPVFDGLAHAGHPLQGFAAVMSVVDWDHEAHGPGGARSPSACLATP